MILLFVVMILLLEHCSANQMNESQENSRTSHTKTVHRNIAQELKINHNKNTFSSEIVNCLRDKKHNGQDCVKQNYQGNDTGKATSHPNNMTIGSVKTGESSLNCLKDIHYTPDNPQIITWKKMITNNYLKTLAIYKFESKDLSIHPEYEGRVNLSSNLPYILQIKNSTLSDEGLYKCVLAYGLPSMHQTLGKFTGYTELRVPHKPTAMTISIKDSVLQGHVVNVTEGDTIIPICTVYNGDPNPIIEWTLDDEPMKGTISQRFYAPIYRNLSEEDTPRKKINTMHEMRVTKDMGGAKLTCKVTQTDSLTHDLHPLTEGRSFIINVLNKTKNHQTGLRPRTDTHLTFHEEKPKPEEQVSTSNINLSKSIAGNELLVKENEKIHLDKATILETAVRTSKSSIIFEERLAQVIKLMNNALTKIIAVTVVFAIFIIAIFLVTEFYCHNRIRNNFNWRCPSITSDEESWGKTGARTNIPDYNAQCSERLPLNVEETRGNLTNLTTTDNMGSGEYEEMAFGNPSPPCGGFPSSPSLQLVREHC